MLLALRPLLLLATLLFGGAAACAEDPSECPEPCRVGQRCFYGACVPVHDAVEEDGGDS